ncbi:MAG: dihydrolipoamide acetyltransferase family protein [bacterium]|nr:dihydrolipoamide acetyltransferase family protein [bacterium]
MRVNVIMPQLGESVAEGTILKWHKKVGDVIAKDEDILEVSTDKVDSEIPATAAGILVEILAADGVTIQVGKTIAVIETDVTEAQSAEKIKPLLIIGEPAPPLKETAPVVAYGAPESGVITVSRPHEAKAPSQTDARRFYSPLVRKIAADQGITDLELDRITGSGTDGRVTKGDLESYLAKRQIPAPSAVKVPTPIPVSTATPLIAGQGEEIVPMDVMRRKIAEHMVRSSHTAVHVTSVSEVDLKNVVIFRERHKAAFEAREGFKLTYTPIIIEAVVKALKEFPYVNSSVDGDNVILKHYINIGMAVALENGLIVPVIKGADGMNLLALCRAVNDLSTRARARKLNPDEVHGSTFSITNPGVFGNLFGSPIINQPNVAILGIGAIIKRPVVLEGDAIAVRPMMYVSLSYDHRIIDGALGGKFLQRVAHYLENFDPEISI